MSGRSRRTGHVLSFFVRTHRWRGEVLARECGHLFAVLRGLACTSSLNRATARVICAAALLLVLAATLLLATALLVLATTLGWGHRYERPRHDAWTDDNRRADDNRRWTGGQAARVVRRWHYRGGRRRIRGERSRRRRRDCESQHRSCSRSAWRSQIAANACRSRRRRHAPARHRCTPANQVGRSWHRFLRVIAGARPPNLPKSAHAGQPIRAPAKVLASYRRGFDMSKVRRATVQPGHESRGHYSKALAVPAPVAHTTHLCDPHGPSGGCRGNE